MEIIMIKHIFKLKTYSHGRKTALLGGIAYLLLGCSIKIASAISPNFQKTAGLGNFFILLCAAMWNVQLLYSLGISGMVSASPYRKRLQTIYPVVLQFLSFLPFLVLISFADLIRIHLNPNLEPELTSALLWSIVVYGFVVLYIGVCYKYFFLASASIFLLGTASGFFVNYFHFFFSAPATVISSFTYVQTLLFGIAIFTVASFVEYVLSTLIHKKPLSKYALSNTLRKQM